MRIKRLELKNFKRFTDLVIENIPETAKLVLLIGANGSGKSSVFDAFELMNTISRQDDIYSYEYYRKNKNDRFNVYIEVEANNEHQIYSTNESNINGLHKPDAFYGRTSFRQISKFVRTSLGQSNAVDTARDTDRPRAFIEQDNRFENDVEKISEQIVREIFRDKVSAQEITQSYIYPINHALENIFKGNSATTLSLLEIIPPLDGNIAQITFKKGNSEIHYNYLSAGEKEVINILMNLLVRKNQFKDTIYFFDEMDLHLNTALQEALLKEITENWIPENCQLWTASHSLGFIKYANESPNACIIDFDNYDFDQIQVLNPQPKDNLEVFEIAVERGFIDKLLKGKTIVYAENQNAPIYNNLLIKDTVFFKAIDKKDAFFKARELQHVGLIDRDYLTDEEVTELKIDYPFLKILPYYSFENLIYHPDNLEEYYQKLGNNDFSKKDYTASILAEKEKNREDIIFGIGQARSGYPFYKENQKDKKLKDFQENSRSIIEILRSAEFEVFYKVFPMKDYAKQIPARHSAKPNDLAKTQWFKRKIEEALQ
jgi:pentatricopeptide repeat protein